MGILYYHIDVYNVQLSRQLSEEKSLLEEELHKINEDLRQKQAEVEGMLIAYSSLFTCAI